MFNFSTIQATCKGPAKDHKYQDYLSVVNEKDYMIACVADGVGSCESSDKGAMLICNTIIKMFANPSLAEKLTQQFTDKIVDEWYSKLQIDGVDASKCKTTSSFVYIDKKKQKMIAGYIGDSPIFIRFGVKIVTQLNGNKDFLNETYALGGSIHAQYQTSLFDINEEHIEFMIATDGFADDIIPERISGLFDYLYSKYSNLKRKKRNWELKRELVCSVKNKNPDDKSLIFGWTCRTN